MLFSWGGVVGPGRQSRDGNVESEKDADGQDVEHTALHEANRKRCGDVRVRRHERVIRTLHRTHARRRERENESEGTMWSISSRTIVKRKQATDVIKRTRQVDEVWWSRHRSVNQGCEESSRDTVSQRRACLASSHPSLASDVSTPRHRIRGGRGVARGHASL